MESVAPFTLHSYFYYFLWLLGFAVGTAALKVFNILKDAGSQL